MQTPSLALFRPTGKHKDRMALVLSKDESSDEYWVVYPDDNQLRFTMQSRDRLRVIDLEDQRLRHSYVAERDATGAARRERDAAKQPFIEQIESLLEQFRSA